MPAKEKEKEKLNTHELNKHHKMHKKELQKEKEKEAKKEKKEQKMKNKAKDDEKNNNKKKSKKERLKKAIIRLFVSKPEKELTENKDSFSNSSMLSIPV